MEESLIMEVWDTFREYVPEKNREMAANQYVDFLLGKDVETSVLEGLLGYDPHLDDAIKTALEDEGGNAEEEDYDSYEEDEDY
tara:strand:+ start:114 stop:362 length:249 start_codon:yes stop_codon:yes gene_type:complete